MKKTVGEIIKKHLPELDWHTDEYQNILSAMEEYANQQQPFPSDEELVKSLKSLLRSYGHRYFKEATSKRFDYDSVDEKFIPDIISLIRNYQPSEQQSNEAVCDCNNQQPDPLTANSVCENCGGDILPEFKNPSK